MVQQIFLSIRIGAHLFKMHTNRLMHAYRYKASFQLCSSGAQREVVFRYPSRRQIMIPIDGRLLGSLWPRDANGLF